MNDVVADHDLTVRRLVLNDFLTNGFVVKENDTGALAIVDPGGRAEDLIAAAREWGGDVRAILVTHLHGDHCAAVGAVAEAFPAADVVGPPGGSFVPDRPVGGGESIEFGTEAIQVTATPGHSPESLSYQICDHVFVGDYLFLHAAGRTDLPGGSAEALLRVVREVFDDMPGKTVLWCGHGPPSTVAGELAANPFWRIAREGRPDAPVERARWKGSDVAVLAWAEDYDGGRKVLLETADGGLVMVPGSQVEDG
ncbi:MAG TPA: MBL fold metallo-hydrolase [Gemmatimonadota bacterium]|nr:MBL fold metallo-hydrolase [Gemmatimonadota bacterium]